MTLTPFIRTLVEKQLEIERERLRYSELARDNYIKQLAELERNIRDDRKRIWEMEDALS